MHGQRTVATGSTTAGFSGVPGQNRRVHEIGGGEEDDQKGEGELEVVCVSLAT
jgi:hypothetical protein